MFELVLIVHFIWTVDYASSISTKDFYIFKSSQSFGSTDTFLEDNFLNFVHM